MRLVELLMEIQKKKPVFDDFSKIDFSNVRILKKSSSFS